MIFLENRDYTLENKHLKIFFSKLLAISEANIPVSMSLFLWDKLSYLNILVQLNKNNN